MSMKNLAADKHEHDNYNYELKRTFTVGGLSVKSYSKVMSDEEKAVCRKNVTEELVRILRTAGKL